MNLFISIFFYMSLSSFARTLSVSEILKLSENYSPQLQSEAFQIRAGEAGNRQAKLIANPFLTYQGGVLKSGTARGGITDLTINQPLPWPGRRGARIAASDFQLKLFELAKEEVKLEVLHRVYALSAEIAALQELESHYQERKRRFNLIEQSLRSRPQASPKQKADRDLIQSQISLMEKSMLDLLARKDALLWELKILTNSEFKKIEFPWKNLPQALNREDYLRLYESSPKYRRFNLEGQLAENRIEQARLEARPDITVGLNYRNENTAPKNHFYHGQVSLVIPIIDHGQHSVQVARAEQKRTLALQTYQKNELASLIHFHFSEHESSKKAIEVFQLKNISKIENKFYDAEVSFRKGFIDALTFLQIDSQIHENIDQIYLSRLSYVISLSQLNLLIGKNPEL